MWTPADDSDVVGDFEQAARQAPQKVRGTASDLDNLPNLKLLGHKCVVQLLYVNQYR